MIKPRVWFPAIRTGTGTDTFTEQLVEGLCDQGIHAKITWLPLMAEYAPHLVPIPKPPSATNIVHVNTWLHTRFIPPRVPVVATSHLCVHDAALAPYKSLPQKIYHRYLVKPLESALLHRAQRIVAVSNYTASCTKSAFDIDVIKVIHNGLASREGQPPEDQYETHRPFRLLYVGNWSMRKGTDLLPQIMEELGYEFQLWYTADSRGKDEKFSLPGNCICLGRLNSESLRNVYTSCDALLFPSRLEGLPLVVLEAMQYGLPVIAANCSSLSEIILSGETGLLCGQDNVKQFASAVKRVAEDQALRHSLRKSAFERVKEHFSIERMVAEYVAVYKDCLVIDANNSFLHNLKDKTANF